ncbi:AAA domain-containing protein [Streptomyces rochei]|uniref:AAA domain-containing protein n=1 Tax=Streptomyces rochei TaxID=1928 RepID=UPI003691378E
MEARNLLAEGFELPCVQELRPDQLADHIDVHTPGHGARNTAVLFTALPKTGFTKRLLDDFTDIGKQTDQIQMTALGALAPDAAQRARALALADTELVRLVTPLPCNEAQAEVIRSAMTRRLTVATGPPGTGESQLVANLVATAIIDGQTVLVASTNNEAVDEVWRRCDRLVPGSVVRTGSARKNATSNAEHEIAALHELRTMADPSPNVATAAVEVDVSADQLSRARDTLAHIATTERQLRQAGEAREEHARQLGVAVTELHQVLNGPTQPTEVEEKAGRLARAWFLGRWRRTRFLRMHGLGAYDGDRVAECLALAGLAAAEADWRDLHSHVASIDDRELSEVLPGAEAAVHAASRTLLASTVQTHARAGRRRILDLLRARDSDRSDWPDIREVLGRAHGQKAQPAVAGWAVTSLSARRFPPGPALFDLVVIDEASQCAIPHILPLLFRARRALVIGDAMQLAHIAKISPEREALVRRKLGLRSEWLEKHRLATGATPPSTPPKSPPAAPCCSTNTSAATRASPRSPTTSSTTVT